MICRVFSDSQIFWGIWRAFTAPLIYYGCVEAERGVCGGEEEGVEQILLEVRGTRLPHSTDLVVPGQRYVLD